ncbi:MAG: hypothetical protein GEU99_03235 [Luteitalea sp.]|nr:hypothetical protein [Luteitalea sp.]
MTRPDPPALAPYLDRLREVPFVRDVALATPPAQGTLGPNTVLKLKTPRRTFPLAVDLKRTFLDRALTNAIIAEHGARLRNRGLPLLLLARYIPRPTGERLAEAGVNFVDQPGNIHLALGDDHHVLLLGRRAPTTETTARRPGPALVKLHFVLLVESEAMTRPVRELADEAGIGKTAAATGLQRLARLGVLGRNQASAYRLVDRRRLADDFLRGYAEVLAPHLEVGRFRAPERDPEAFLQRLAGTAAKMHVSWAVSGTPAAYLLNRFYRGNDLPVFVEGSTQTLQRALRLVPEREGPITLFRAFGRRWLWQVIAGVPVAHPWLVYAELVRQGEPRALEAAELTRDQYLTS